MSDTTAVEFIDKASFSTLVERTTREKNISHMDAVLEICRIRNIEIEGVSNLLTGKLRKMIQNEADNLNLLKKSRSRRLPFQ
jgi:hypothetical protein